ncbi:MAG: hypothetical protein ACE5EH_06110 [Gammaproteobacteria bacterium]
MDQNKFVMVSKYEVNELVKIKLPLNDDTPLGETLGEIKGVSLKHCGNIGYVVQVLNSNKFLSLEEPDLSPVE